MENDVYRARPKKRKKGWIPFVVLVFIYVFRQAYLINANSVDTVKAAEGYINNSIISQGIICREETVLSFSGNGAIDYLAENGERVSKGYALANIYPSVEDIEKIKLLRNRQALLRDINRADEYINNTTLDMSVTRKQLTQQLADLSEISYGNDYSTVDSKLADLTLSLNKVGVATGRIKDFSQARKQIESEIYAVKSTINRPLNNLYSSYTGYFLHNPDGYENIATTDNFLNFNYSQGNDIISGAAAFSAPRNSYGKIITDYKWSICTYVDSSMAERIKPGAALSVSINVGDNEYYKATVKNVVDKGDKTLVVLQCSNMNDAAAKTRVTDCEILFRQYTGIKIPKSAIHFEGEQMGVFVNFSNLVQFKKISPVYEDENYVIVPATQSADNQVKMHDSIIVKGRNLYDGKYL
ncbi:MAG: hypothetical protein II977_02240 [Oscillospiraceae bacterium]|nr:hypothetical protein [Oscillospiraceae bacterium]